MANKILLVTVTKIEAAAVFDVFSNATGAKWVRRNINGKTYYDLGKLGNLEIYMVQSEMGISGVGASLSTVSEAIRVLHPTAIIMLGIAFGVKPEEQRLGDILVSKQVLAYEPGKMKAGFNPRGDRSTCSEVLLDKFRSGEHDWRGANVHFGLLLSGEKLVADPAFRDWLLAQEPEAIGGEMEAAGLYIAARKAKTDWIVVKGICDWGDENKDDAAQSLAAKNSADFVLHVLRNNTFDNSNKRVDLILEGVAEDCDEKCIESLITILSGMTKVDRKNVRIVRVISGSIVVECELPQIAANRLFETARNNDFLLAVLGVKSIIVYGLEGIETHAQKDNDFVKYDPEHKNATMSFFRSESIKSLSVRLARATKLVTIADPFIQKLEEELTTNSEKYFAGLEDRNLNTSKDLLAIVYFKSERKEVSDIKENIDYFIKRSGSDYRLAERIQLVIKTMDDFKTRSARTLDLMNAASVSPDNSLAGTTVLMLRGIHSQIDQLKPTLNELRSVSYFPESSLESLLNDFNRGLDAYKNNLLAVTDYITQSSQRKSAGR